MKLVAIIKIMDEDSGFVVQECDRIELRETEHSFSQAMGIYECHFEMAIHDSLERLCEREKRRKRLQKREEGEE